MEKLPKFKFVSEPLHTPAITYWSDGSTEHECRLSAAELEFARPYVVQIRSKGYIAANVVVFALNPEHALSRVIQNLEYSRDNNYKPRDERITDRAGKILSRIISKELSIQVSDYDIGRISQTSWASNDTIT